MADPFTLMIAQAGMAAVGGFVQANQAAAQAEAMYEANQQNLEFLADDVRRRKGEIGQEYQEAVSDRVMRANQEIAQAELLSLNRGVSGTTMQSIVRNLATVEGIDVSRIRNTYESQSEALNSELESAAMGVKNSNRQAYNTAKTQTTSAILGAVGSGLQIYSGYRRDQAALSASKNKTA